MRMRAAAYLVVLCFACVASVHAQTRKTQEQTYERYVKYAGDPIDQFQFWSMYKWTLAGPTTVVVWPNINEAYLISVDDPCPGLEWAKAIGVTSKQPRFVGARFDFVTFEKGRCHIRQIRPIDVKAMGNAEKETN